MWLLKEKKIVTEQNLFGILKHLWLHYNALFYNRVTRINYFRISFDMLVYRWPKHLAPTVSSGGRHGLLA